MRADPYHATRRFGLGRRGAEPLPDDPRQWLSDQLNRRDPALDVPVSSIADALRTQQEFEMGLSAGKTGMRGLAGLFRDECAAALTTAIRTTVPVTERLVWLWTNHFTISGRAGGNVFGFAADYIKTAIRPHATGRIVDLLRAAILHPAMLLYLDNVASAGPLSRHGRAYKIGLNENLARECLELHTVGLAGNYSQADVIALAEMLSGFKVRLEGNNPGMFFDANTHQPGTKMLMGQRFAEGQDGLLAALEFLGTHPATYRRVAERLVRHYVADNPKAEHIETVARAFDRSGGQVRAAMEAVFDLPEAWQPFVKFKSPIEYLVSAWRALDMPSRLPSEIADATIATGQPFLSAPLPNGYPDTFDDWMSGDAILRRADWAMDQCQREGAPSLSQVMEAQLGGPCSDATQAAIARLGDRREQLATFLVSREFLWR